jgi:ferredoxin-type protein NapG
MPFSDDDRPVDRRRFFRQGLRELFKPLAKAVEPVERAAKQLADLEKYDAPPTPVRTPEPGPWLRPPGARPESDFLMACSRCQACVNVCPAHCIKLDPTGIKGGGAPYIEPNEMPCILCNGLLCMPACPTGALIPTDLAGIDMGTAVWDEHVCVRTHGEECTACVDHCPVGTVALEVIDSKIVVHENGCTGCGTCQSNCPTEPKSIFVRPKSARY